jgi:hypothetical protein
MVEYDTNYGILTNIGDYISFVSGALKDCILEDKVELNTPYGILIPQYEFSDYRRKFIHSLSFYEDGTLRRVSLNEQTDIQTPIGNRKAELITFYESGAIKRLFPLNGHLTAYWEEAEEYQLATEDIFYLPCGNISAKIISIYFYQDGTIKSLTFWPNEIITISAPIGEIEVRIGLSFYRDGRIHSLEPATPVPIHTSIGLLKAYDETANGITGDNNSLVFNQNGEVKSLKTSNQKVIAINQTTKEIATFLPYQEVDCDGEEISFHPLKIDIDGEFICFNDSDKLEVHQYQFFVRPYTKTAINPCANCTSNGKCTSECKNQNTVVNLTK